MTLPKHVSVSFVMLLLHCVRSLAVNRRVYSKHLDENLASYRNLLEFEMQDDLEVEGMST